MSMKTDDPRLEEARKVAFERAKAMDVLRLAVSKHHLAMEQAMDSFLDASLYHPSHVRENRFNFSHKAQICRSVAYKQDEDRIWSVLWSVNAVRNELAHSLETPDLKKKMDRLRAVYLETLTPKQAEAAKGLSDEHLAIDACVLVAGFLATIEDDANARRKVVDKHWKPRS